ncbi:isochorismatase domain-containing protein 2 [Parus major]|uniref:isochorismatase domain-containing protein 2 n=1 Tax=Parus major TaxID=9157 RepID=UPI0014439628|nr:isochorismatase domain-containing protein 2 [Parus major]
MAAGRLGRPLPGSSVLFLCDLQERFRSSIAAFPQIVAVAARMLQGCRILGVPVLVTEQRPDVLGPTVPELGAQDLPRIPKTAFSMVGAAAPLLGDPKIRSVLLCGIEAQACILVRAPRKSGGGLGAPGGRFGEGTPNLDDVSTVDFPAPPVTSQRGVEPLDDDVTDHCQGPAPFPDDVTGAGPADDVTSRPR